MKGKIKPIIIFIIIFIVFTIVYACEKLDNNNKEIAPLNLEEIEKFQTRHNIDIDYYSYFDDGYYETEDGNSGHRSASFDVGGYLEQLHKYLTEKEESS